ncbi:MAG: SgcJ/EcaC family oxidoreductase [Acidobacteria bacterium]|nr:SgcJ/EcaC family oxidoreductase [Acidobacteriota bacterium]
METDEHQIRLLMDEWRRATAEGDLQAVLALMSDDAVFLTPGNPPMTKEDFAAGFKGFAGRVRIESDQDVKEIHATGDLAYAWSHLVVVMTATDSGKKTRRAGHVLTVFRKSPAGQWLLSRDANLMAAGAPEEA